MQQNRRGSPLFTDLNIIIYCSDVVDRRPHNITNYNIIASLLPICIITHLIEYTRLNSIEYYILKSSTKGCADLARTR